MVSLLSAHKNRHLFPDVIVSYYYYKPFLGVVGTHFFVVFFGFFPNDIPKTYGASIPKGTLNTIQIKKLLILFLLFSQKLPSINSAIPADYSFYGAVCVFNQLWPITSAESHTHHSLMAHIINGINL